MSEQFNEILSELESWYSGGHGPYLLDETHGLLQKHLETAFGYHILQLGPLRGHSLIGDSRINHRIFAGNRPGAGVGLICDSDELPLESDSVDVIVAHHCLEFSANPHQVLRELQRVLTPQGHLLLVGFNPVSLRGLNTAVRRMLPSSPWKDHHPVGERRLNDWLRLVGCEPHSSSYIYSIPQVGSGRFRAALQRCDQWCNAHNLPIGGVYMVHAIKQQSAQTPARLGLRKRGEKLIGLAVPKPRPAPSPTPSVPAGTGGITTANRTPTGDVAA